VQQKSAYTDFQSMPGRAPNDAAGRIEPIVSSTFLIGGFSPRLQGLGLFSAPRNGIAGAAVAGAPRMMRCRNRAPVGRLRA
jgi:hypothetical protein